MKKLYKIFIITLLIPAVCLADAADWDKPNNTTPASSLTSEIRAIAKSAAALDYTNDTNLFSVDSGTKGPIRYNRSTKKFQEYISAAWADKEITGLADDAVSTSAKVASAAKDGNATTDLVVVSQAQNSSFTYAGATAGTANAQTATLSPAPSAYSTGQEFDVVIGSGLTNTGSATINFNSLGAKTIKKALDTDLQAGDLVAGFPYKLRYDGTNMVLMNYTHPYLFRSSASNSITGTVAVTTLTTGSSCIPANILGTTKGARFTVMGYINNNTGSAQNTTFNLNFGGTLVHSYTPSVATSSASRAFQIIFDVYPTNATSGIYSYAQVAIGYPSAGTTTMGSIAHEGTNYHSITKDITVSQCFEVTVQAANTGQAFERKYESLEIL